MIRASVAEARARLLALAAPLPGENVTLGAAAGRILAEPVCSVGDVPAFPRSRVDGFAVGEASVAAAQFPGSGYRIVAIAMAGTAPGTCRLGAGEAARVMTGAPLPMDTWAVVPFEEARPGGDGQLGDVVVVPEPIQTGANVLALGSQMHAGEALLPPGTTCGPQELALLAAAGCSCLKVHRRPRVVVFATGSELAPTGAVLAPGQIHASNDLMLAAACREWGAAVTTGPAVPDDTAALATALAAAADGSELVVFSGGSAGGDRDYARAAIQRLGWQLELDGVDLHPGGRLTVARVGDQSGPLAFALSGGPGACLAAAALLLFPTVARLAGGAPHPWQVGLTAPVPLPKHPRLIREGARAVPVHLWFEAGHVLAAPLNRPGPGPKPGPSTDAFLLTDVSGAPAEPTEFPNVACVWPVRPAVGNVSW